jgi:hypothetical protein
MIELRGRQVTGSHGQRQQPIQTGFQQTGPSTAAYLGTSSAELFGSPPIEIFKSAYRGKIAALGEFSPGAPLGWEP